MRELIINLNDDIAIKKINDIKDLVLNLIIKIKFD